MSERVRAPVIADRITPIGPVGVTVSGYLGRRVAANDSHLALVDLEPLLAGFRSRPGTHPWIGEHIGKWLHAAALTYERTRDAGLEDRLRYAVASLLATQGPDGYLGTYRADRRFGMFDGADWDVWVHKYVLIGLLAYHDATGDTAALDAARRVGDLLDATFRSSARPKRIVEAGTHVGMAATSVLEPIVGLHRRTGDDRYLDFAWSIVEALDCVGGPRVLSTLRTSGHVREIGNGKSYEMLSNLVGLCEMARATGDRELVELVVCGWEDVVRNHRYVTGGASHAEHFGLPGELPDPMAINVAETCVTVTWLQLTHHLLCLTGEARFGDELERTAFNQLLAAQHPDGRTWCYYTALAGTKPYGPGISCCVSSGPRGVAMLPAMIYGRTVDGRTAITLHEASSIDGVSVSSNLWATGAATIDRTDGSSSGILIRAPDWAVDLTLDGIPIQPDPSGWLAIDPAPRHHVDVRCEIQPQRIEREAVDAGGVALAVGPFVLGYSTAVAGHDRRTPAFDVVATDQLSLEPGGPGDAPTLSGSRLSNRIDGIVDLPIRFVPFSEVGVDGSPYRLWFSTSEPAIPVSLLGAGSESRSAGSIDVGSAIDYVPYSFASTFDGADHDEDWFAVTLDAPVSIARVVVGHGWSWVNGGWFDASAMVPLVEVRRALDDPWQAVGELDRYPGTTAADPTGLRGGERFSVVLPAPIRVIAVRVRGRGSHGAYPPARYATCGELSAFAD